MSTDNAKHGKLETLSIGDFVALYSEEKLGFLNSYQTSYVLFFTSLCVFLQQNWSVIKGGAVLEYIRLHFQEASNNFSMVTNNLIIIGGQDRQYPIVPNASGNLQLTIYYSHFANFFLIL